MVKNILIVFGTRPEAIKLAPVILELKKYPSLYNVIVCNTEQQKELSNQTLEFFNIKADIKLDCMRENQKLVDIQSRIMLKLQEVFSNNTIYATIVQGDTMSVLCGALVSFYNKVPVFHIEAGLRSNDIFEPFPEEAIRAMVSKITTLHFAPTNDAVKALKKEGINKNIFMVGNTSIDALKCLSDEIMQKTNKFLDTLNKDKLVLVTIHRRENHGDRLNFICKAIKDIASKFKDHSFLIPVHPNPNVKIKIYKELSNISNIILTEPLEYPMLINVMKNSKLILTDSGGIQEEAPSFNVPILVLRYETERIEGINAGFSKLVGADYNKIINETTNILIKNKEETRIYKDNPYGNGNASANIVNIIGKIDVI
ncbi:UDP-N-acetylglucosamine 2-epimerase (non-hydrolyzing) [Campylobacter sp. 2018MI13]|uniref:non-hydrolyzing UDP-N-acetylglucosamine 2-epimerase n=1 Tax=Campylobacter sp. 2018MI13 TaxID=2836737 RepID=UPI001BD9DF4C|nr:UDP-N-acetylglucosamine 2-epimerase (non-hydrolyzing) [Campylobacter sp. 2018MI13]MBT0882103.1 UDP-N-acetylglucosamine 2-epimerase (non-hydrolyzing) [Campylobacter sp. 2018MI13]